MNKLLTNLLKFVLFFGVGFVLLYFVYQGQQKGFQAKCDLDFVEQCIAGGSSKAACEAQLPVADCSLMGKIIDDFKSVKYFWILLVVLAFMLSNISRALRWNMLIRPMGYPVRFFNTFWATMAGYFANMALPRFGEVVKPGLVYKYEKIPLEKLIGTIVVDRTLDVICLASMIGMAFLLEFDRIWEFVRQNATTGGDTSGLILLASIAGAMSLILLVLGYIFRAKIMASAIFTKIKVILFGFWEGILTIRKLERPGLFLFHTVFIWVMYYMMTYLCFFAFAPTENLGLVAGLTVFVFGGLGMVIPAPGGMGSYQFLVTQAAILYGVAGDDAFSFSNILFITVSLCNIVGGIIAFAVLPMLNKKYPRALEEGIKNEE